MALLVALLSPLFAQADTIYLKNGRQIQGTNAVKQNGKVTFETAAGTMSVPESLVDRIVSGDPPIAPQTNSNSAAAELSMAPPSSSSPDSASVLQLILPIGRLGGLRVESPAGCCLRMEALPGATSRSGCGARTGEGPARSRRRK